LQGEEEMADERFRFALSQASKRRDFDLGLERAMRRFRDILAIRHREFSIDQAEKLRAFCDGQQTSLDVMEQQSEEETVAFRKEQKEKQDDYIIEERKYRATFEERIMRS
jgi:hypothetical protein